MNNRPAPLKSRRQRAAALVVESHLNRAIGMASAAPNISPAVIAELSAAAAALAPLCAVPSSPSGE